MIFTNLDFKRLYRVTTSLILTCIILGAVGATIARINNVFAIHYSDVVVLQVGSDDSVQLAVNTFCAFYPNERGILIRNIRGFVIYQRTSTMKEIT